jgi:hypothetical protein
MKDIYDALNPRRPEILIMKDVCDALNTLKI